MFLNGMVDESENSASDDADIEDLPFWLHRHISLFIDIF